VIRAYFGPEATLEMLMRCATFLVVLLAMGCAGSQHAVHDSAEGPEFAATDLEGYWRCASDGSVTHITNVGLPSGGSGSYTPPDGAMVPDGKFRGIHFLERNRWEAMENERARPGFVGDEDDPFTWRRVTIEMLDRNAFRIGKTVYHRQ
jgi:hypothetical protein